MNQLMIFEGKQVEVFEHNGQVLFNPKHVGECLDVGHSGLRNHLAEMGDTKRIKLTNSDVLSKDFRKLNNAGEIFITESGVYDLIFKSRKPEAIKFKDWVTDEVLPTLRKTGTYTVEPQFQIPTTFADALRLAADQQEQIQILEFEDTKNKQIIGELQPKATYYDLVLQNKSLLSVTKIAKDYGMSARKLNDKLHTLGIQFKQGDCWFLYQKHATKGYTQTKTHVIDDKSGKTNMYWTQKGRLFIYETLKQEGILPLIEREQDETAS